MKVIQDKCRAEVGGDKMDVTTKKGNRVALCSSGIASLFPKGEKEPVMEFAPQDREEFSAFVGLADSLITAFSSRDVRKTWEWRHNEDGIELFEIREREVGCIAFQGGDEWSWTPRCPEGEFSVSIQAENAAAAGQAVLDRLKKKGGW